MIDESAEGDCDPFLCVRPACMRGDYIYRGKGYSGEFVGLNGETTFVIGRIIHCSFAPSESAGNPGEGAVGFAPDFFANNPPLNQSVIDIASWLGPRRAAEEGRINMSPDHVDGILTALMSQQPPTRRPILVPHGFKFPTGDTCTDNWLVCRDNARVTYQAEINACAGTYVGSGLALGAGVCGAAAAAGGGIGATVGLICGSPTGPGALGTATAGGTVGGVIGLCVGAVSGTVCCVEEVINGQDRCEEDALRKADLALKHCRKIYEICKLKNPVGKGGK